MKKLFPKNKSVLYVNDSAEEWLDSSLEFEETPNSLKELNKDYREDKLDSFSIEMSCLD